MGIRVAREAAMSLLYEYSIKDELGIETIDQMDDVFPAAELYAKNRAYVAKILENFGANKDKVDEIISKYCREWKAERLPKTDLAILRLAVTEILYFDDIPEKVSVNEAVESAKKYSTDNSPKFINGLLGAYLKDKEENK